MVDTVLRSQLLVHNKCNTQLFVKARVMRAVTLIILSGAAAFAPRNALPVTARRSPTRQTARMVIG